MIVMVNICTTKGFVNLAFVPNVTSAPNACFCNGQFRTLGCATTASACNNYCQGSFCINGGSPGLDITKCSCPFPFTGSDCSQSLCIASQTLINDSISNQCVCKPGYTGFTCENQNLFERRNICK